jgi:S1-C subfamily serine protease
MLGTTLTLRVVEDPHPYSLALRPRPYRLGLPAASTGGFGRSSKSGHGAWSELSEPVVSRLSRSVVSIASFIGDTMLLERTGICIQTSSREGNATTTSFLTSASLGPRTAEGKIGDNVTIKVRLPDGQIVNGRIELERLFIDYAVVNIEHVAGLHAANLDHHDTQFTPYRKVVAVWRRFTSGLLMATSGVQLGSPVVEPYEIMFSTCQINTAGIGGPLLDFDGNFLGMNSYRSQRKKTPFLQRVLILEPLGSAGIVSMGTKQRMDDDTTSTPGNNSSSSSSRAVVLPRVINSYEDVFSDDTWGVLRKGVASRVSRSVVSLASFDGNAAFFACTGFVIDCNACSAKIVTSASLVRVSGDVKKIKTDLRIEVCLRNRFRVIGILKSYDLTLNVACIEIMGYWNLLALRVSPHAYGGHDIDVIALGCIFDGFKIMATSGKLLRDHKSKLNCPDLSVSTCKITRAGVGGPLMDTSGNLLGMNFYHHQETPFIPQGYLFPVTDSTGDVSGIGEYTWPLPKPSLYRRTPPRELTPKRVRSFNFDFMILKRVKKPEKK